MASQELIELRNQADSQIKASGITEELAHIYCQIAEAAFQTEKDKDFCLETSRRAKGHIDSLAKMILDGNGDIWTLESIEKANNSNYGIVNQYYNMLKLESRDLFDSYLLYLEKNRVESEKFYAPKMEQLNKHGLIQAMQDLENDKYDRLCISMPPGTQKAQPLYSKVLTPSGFIRMGDVKVGTKVISGTGNVCNVTGVYPQGIKKIYELTFDDGSKCRCSDEHLWTVQTRDDRRRKNKDGSEKYRTITLNEMLKNYKVENGKRCNYSIDYVDRIDFPKKDLLIHPYVLGILIGDGALSSGNLNISTNDDEILENVKSFLPEEYELHYRGGCDYRIRTNVYYTKGKSDLTKALERYGLKGKTSIEKFIPEEYLTADCDSRLWLLRGLMDTDGSASDHYCSYATISEKLADDVIELVHSLGGYASKARRKAGYRKNGEYKRCNDYFEIIIEFDSKMESIFALKRKAEKYKPKRKVMKRFITDIKYVADEECQCIYIDDESHLYITDNYIITHNTTLEKFFSSWIIGKYPKDYSLFFSHNSDITEKFYKGVLDITTDNIEYTWGEIFPEVKLQATNAKLQEINFDKYKPYSSIQCSSIGSKNAGKVRTNRYLYCDDLIGTIEEALNPIILDKIWRIYGVDLKQRKLNEQVKEIIIMTRWSTKDVIGRIIELYGNSPRTKIIAVPDIDPVTGKSNFDYKYNGMSVAFFQDQALTMDEISYKCLYKQEPIEREGLLYPENSIKRFKEEDIPKTKVKRITGQCDTKGKGTDYFVFPCLYEFEGYEGEFYCMDTICNNSADYEAQYENAANLIVNHKMQDCDFESNQGGDRVALEVQKRVEEKGWICKISDTPTETNKEARIFQCSNWVLQHIHFKDRSMYSPKDEYGVMMSMLLRHSVSGKNPNDDVPDVFSNFALRMKGKGRKNTVEAIKNPFRTGGYGYYEY